MSQGEDELIKGEDVSVGREIRALGGGKFEEDDDVAKS
jgi:hypothetical protein